MALRELEDGIRQLQLRDGELAVRDGELAGLIAGIQTALDKIEPVGVMSAWAGNTAPTGWLLCQGQAVSRTTYAKLFALIGTTYGAGNGSSTFNVPNAKGSVLVGVDTAQTEFAARGQTGGAKTVALVPAEIPATSTGRHVDATQFETAATNAPLVGTTGSRHKYRINDVAAAHNNLQPYLTVQYIIKAL